MWNLLYLYSLETTRTREIFHMIRTALNRFGAFGAQLWNSLAPDMAATDTHSPSPARGNDIPLRGKDAAPDRADAPKTARFTAASQSSPPSRAAPPPPSRHRPGTPLDQKQQPCAGAGQDAGLFQQGGVFHETDFKNISGSKSRHPALNRNQAACLAYITAYWGEYGIGPTYQEIADAVGATTKSIIHRSVQRLQEIGFITTVPRKSRAIRLRKRR